MVLSGMSTFEQVEQDIEYASRSGINHLSHEEIEAIDKAIKKYREITPIACTSCFYCLPCPNEVYIPENFTIYNEGILFGDFDSAKLKYADLKGKSEECIECGTCEPKCPQKLPIIELLKKVKAELG